MKISTKGRYALRFMIDLVQYGNGNYTSLKDVIARQHISPKYLEQIATALGKAGLIHSVRGPQGGYKLSRQPESYTIGDILRPIEGNLACVACLETTPNECPQYPNCTAVRFWEGLHRVVLNYLNSISLKELADMRDIGPCPHISEPGRQLSICF